MKLSQEEAALILGISRQYYSSIENGWKRPSSHLAKKLLIVLDLKMNGINY